MAQREVECKDAASPLFRINDITADKCHADSNAVDRQDGADDDNKDNVCNDNDDNNNENHVKDCRNGDEEKAASPADDAASASLAKGSGVVGKNSLPLISQQGGGNPPLSHPTGVGRRNVPLQPVGGHGGLCRIIPMVRRMNIIHLIEKQQNYRDGINEGNIVNDFISSSNLRIRYHNIGNIVLELSLVSQIKLKIVEARRRQEFFKQQ